MYTKLVKDMLPNKPSSKISKKKEKKYIYINERERGLVTDKEIQHREQRRDTEYG